MQVRVRLGALRSCDVQKQSLCVKRRRARKPGHNFTAYLPKNRVPWTARGQPWQSAQKVRFYGHPWSAVLIPVQVVFLLWDLAPPLHRALDTIFLSHAVNQNTFCERDLMVQLGVVVHAKWLAKLSRCAVYMQCTVSRREVSPWKFDIRKLSPTLNYFVVQDYCPSLFAKCMERSRFHSTKTRTLTYNQTKFVDEEGLRLDYRYVYCPRLPTSILDLNGADFTARHLYRA